MNKLKNFFCNPYLIIFTKNFFFCKLLRIILDNLEIETPYNHFLLYILYTPFCLYTLKDEISFRFNFTRKGFIYHYKTNENLNFFFYLAKRNNIPYMEVKRDYSLCDHQIKKGDIILQKNTYTIPLYTDLEIKNIINYINIYYLFLSIKGNKFYSDKDILLVLKCMLGF